MAGEDDGPAKDCRSQVFADRKLDETDRGWQTGNEVPKVKCTASPRVLLAYQMLEGHQRRQIQYSGCETYCVLLNSHHGCISKGDLV
jgi:hypothetical protein